MVGFLSSLIDGGRRVIAAPMSIRAWVAAKTSRLNSAKYATATGTTYNDDLDLDGAILRARTKEEVQNNGFVKGVIQTHVTDVVGPCGPTLEVQSGDKDFNEALESLWRAWWKAPCVDGTSGVDLLGGWIRSLWHNGEFLARYILLDDVELANVREEDPRSVLGKIPLRIYDIHPRRLETPMGDASNFHIRLGVERDKLERKVAYHIRDEWANDPSAFPAMYSERFEARDVIHGFLKEEAGQVRGAPWMASTLEPVSDLREYDTSVMDASRSAADHAVLLTTQNADVPFVQLNDSTPIKRRQMTALPPGYQATQINPQQPSQRYVEFRHERLREIGRPVGMPLMLILCDASRHNYSSARMDIQVYQRFIACLQAWLGRVSLNRLLRELAKYGRMVGLLKELPADCEFVWHWPKMPHVDPNKEANAAAVRLATGQSTLHDELAAIGVDYDHHLQTLAKEITEVAATGGIHPFLRDTLKIILDANAKEEEEAAAADEDAKPQPADDDEAAKKKRAVGLLFTQANAV